MTSRTGVVVLVVLVVLVAGVVVVGEYLQGHHQA